MEIERRTFLATSAAAAAVATQAGAAGRDALVDVKIDPWNQPPEIAQLWSKVGGFRHQDDESRQDFTRGVMSFIQRDAARPEQQQHLAAFLKSKKINPLDDVEMTDEEAFQLLVQDPAYAARTRLARTNFALHWDNPRRAFHKEADYYLSEMEKTDNAGPGRLELNPDLDIPDSARHEIHAMPGGYVGEPFAGWIYELGHMYGTADLKDRGRAVSYTQAAKVPADGKVRRILDLGCSMGDGTLAFKMRFPNAEVWGVDVAGPLLRYAHYRAVKVGMDVIYSQRNGENTGLPDGYFDIVGSCITFHEIAPDAQKRVMKEIHRILRPGGVYHHVDFMTDGHPDYTPIKTVAGRAGRWVDHRHNVETWSPAYRHSDFPGLMRAVGFDVDFSQPPAGNSVDRPRSFPTVTGIKRA